jgi:hypothetical protein
MAVNRPRDICSGAEEWHNESFDAEKIYWMKNTESLWRKKTKFVKQKFQTVGMIKK